MVRHYFLSTLLVILGLCTTTKSVVDDITGDLGSPQTGSLTISGGTSGGKFDSSTTTITHSFDFISLPLTTSTNGQIIIGNEPILHNFGTPNHNLFVGSFSGNFTTTGSNNTGCGVSTLNSVTSGTFNTAVGHASLINLTDGLSNVALGSGAGSNIVSGSNNIVIGIDAGSAYNGTEANNIIIGAHPGVSTEINTIRIGSGGQQTDCYIDGIYGATVESDTALPAFVDVSGKLGTIVSAEEYKYDIKKIGNDSRAIWRLRPVSFYLKSDKTKVKQFGLIAKQVHKVMPDLVVKDKKGAPYAVRYHELPVLLLNELQQMSQRVDKLEEQFKKMAEHIKELESRLKK